MLKKQRHGPFVICRLVAS